jgi:type I restriction enzyme S subunit
MKQGWEIKKLGEVLKVQNGYAFNSKLFTLEAGTPLIRIRDIKNGIGTETNFNGSYDKKYEVKAGDFLIGMDGEFGCYEWKDGTALLNQRVCRLQDFSNKLHPRFLFYGINKYLKAIEDVTAFATVKHISSKQIEAIKIPLPPLPEQQRIVAILDEAFAAIAKAKANAQQNLQNAKELFESYLQGVFENKGEGWEEQRFDEICVLQRGFDLPTHSRNEGSFPLVSSNGITDRIDLWKVKAPGVVTGRSGTIGNVHFIEEDYWPLNTALYIKEFHGNYERYIYYFLKQFDLSKYSSGAGVPTLNRNNVHSVKVWFPKSVSEQQAIVQKLDALSAETKKLESIYQQKIKDLEELKKSILQKAFSGELASDEPAELKTKKTIAV